MDEAFDAETILREVLEVLRRHGVPAETVALNISLPDATFDELIPQLRTYKAGVILRAWIVEGVPADFRAQRRYPFEEIEQALEARIRPDIETFAKALREEFPGFAISFTSATTSPAGAPAVRDERIYRLGVDCRVTEDVHADYGQLVLSVYLRQINGAAYPKLDAWAGWLVDEESGNDWGVEVFDRPLAGGLDYAPHQLDLLRRALPGSFMRIRAELGRKRSEG